MKLKVITLNLWIGGLLFDEIVAFLEKEAADIVMLQEVMETKDTKLPAHYYSIESLQAKLNYPYTDFAPTLVNKFPWVKVTEGNAVLSRFPIKDRGVAYFEAPFDESNLRNIFDPSTYATTPRNLEHVVLDTPAGDINVFNFQGVWDLDGDNVSPQRERMRDVILQEIDGKQNVILAGDTNAKHTNPVMRDIEKQLTNVFGDSLTTSFNMRRKDNPGYATAVVDMIYVSPDISVLEKSCPDIDISDHLPLIATLEIPKRQEDHA
ncbi:MAG TPA: endonuclease/exonuclease/phosphatase family protein [Candidatus Saccharimonadales bacterium]|nr:endonuclease/exonuclease/phosphatase family protein [Candidatus Saccharimonadales bacterium]